MSSKSQLLIRGLPCQKSPWVLKAPRTRFVVEQEHSIDVVISVIGMVAMPQSHFIDAVDGVIEIPARSTVEQITPSMVWRRDGK